jgi:hypothetical protein
LILGKKALMSHGSFMMIGEVCAPLDVRVKNDE